MKELFEFKSKDEVKPFIDKMSEDKALQYLIKIEKALKSYKNIYKKKDKVIVESWAYEQLIDQHILNTLQANITTTKTL